MTENTAAENSDNLQDISQRFRGYYPVVVDVETAGFDPKNSALLEVAFCTLKINENGDFEKDEMFHCNIKPFPNSAIEEANIKFLGIDPFDPAREALDEKVGLLPIFKQLNKKVKKAGCKRAILVGHNAHFDHSFIMAAAERLNFKRNPFHPFTVMDTATLASLFLGHSVLSVACETAGIPFDAGSAHDAAYDTDREAELFCYFVNRFRKLGGWPLCGEDLDRANEAKNRYANRNSTAEETPAADAEGSGAAEEGKVCEE
ncbi:ribonuclease T [Ruminobacter sp. RM87]|uniref:ribonuclease T n=1 Tax=Ruminobacter sp. RM87 TaxID=1200567 RepID=UPI0009FE17D8|nr:ribonuclease T [Ruminobacter sp. RM87]